MVQYVPQMSPDIKRNRYLPPLIQTQPASDSKQFRSQHQNIPKGQAAMSVAVQNRSDFSGIEESVFLQCTGRVGNMVDRSRRNYNASVDASNMSMQEDFSAPRPVMHSRPGSIDLNQNRSTTQNRNQSSDGAAGTSFSFKVYGSTENEKIFIFTGTVERVIKWNKIFRNHFCYYEVIASVISIQEGTVSGQKIMLLRDKKGPILQVVYYVTTTHIDIEDFHVEQILRCLGRMSAPNILNAISIRTATKEEVESLQRLNLVCDQAVSHFLSA
ncbi:hypothetical protein NQ315_001634 [Exocentrus adspersus]|uniref:Uncharacterized protein n=1 Tax=Exocentrus adspersus TaxID=1586481 RepID=A0AAV8W9S7_9CUCU|nr:hypothetical protein NQ315_001634 [Exocentrus adspersus]